jgi:hypothetical protein
LEVTREHLQNHISQEYMTATEFATYLVPVDSVCHHIGFSTRSYDLEVHHLTPSGILDMAVVVTLCEAYIGIEPHLNRWSYFFWAWL